MVHVGRSIYSLSITAMFAFALIAAPVGLDDQLVLEEKSAFAKGKGSGNSGGKGGKGGDRSGGDDLVKGKKNQGDTDTADLEEGDGHHDGAGKGHEKARGNGHHKHHGGDSDAASHDDDEHGNGKNHLGKLSAANASETAREHASENSVVGMLAAYAAMVNGDDGGDGLSLEEAREELGAISNKSDDEGLVDEEVVREVNALLGTDPLNDDPVAADED